MPWEPKVNFVTTRLPQLLRRYLSAPVAGGPAAKAANALEEHLSPTVLRHCIRFIYEGFLGEGSI